MRDTTKADRVRDSLPIRTPLEAMALAVMAEEEEVERLTIAVATGIVFLPITTLN